MLNDDPLVSTGKLYIISAPSGGGKTTLVSALIAEFPNLCLSISHTTRSMRPGEKDGTNYHFIDDDTFDSMIDAGVFLEHAHVFGHRYGTSREWVNKTLQSGRDVILEIDWQGARVIREKYSEVLSIFILPPSILELKERLVKRCQDSPQTIEKRFSESQREVSHWDEYDYIIVNDKLESALSDIKSILQCSRLTYVRQKYHLKNLVGNLLKA